MERALGGPSGVCGPSAPLSLSQTKTGQLSSAHHDPPVTTLSSVQPVASAGPHGVSGPVGCARVKLGDSGCPPTQRSAPFSGVRFLHPLSGPAAVLLRPRTGSASASPWEDGTGRAVPLQGQSVSLNKAPWSACAASVGTELVWEDGNVLETDGRDRHMTR